MKFNAFQIQPIGEYFQNDRNGYVINPASREKIPLQWLPVIEAVKRSFINQIGDHLHSIYLRGSLVRDMAIDGFSDLDSFALLKGKNLRWQDAPWTKELNEVLLSKYKFVGEIELMLTSILDNSFFKNPNLPMIIKTQSICIYGEDLSPSIPKFKPNRTMMLNYRWIESDFIDFMVNEERSERNNKNFLNLSSEPDMKLLWKKNASSHLIYTCVLIAFLNIFLSGVGLWKKHFFVI